MNCLKVRRLDRRDKGYTRIEWLLDYYERPKRIRKWYPSNAQAEGAMNELKQQHRETGQNWLVLSPEERSGLMSIYGEAQAAGITLRTVWEAYMSGKLDAAPPQRRTLLQAIAETMEAKLTENLRERYRGDLEKYPTRFAAGRAEMFIDKIGVAEIEQWFAGRGEALTTRKSNLGRLGSMFDVCWRPGYLKDNPILRNFSPKIDHGIPERFTADRSQGITSRSQPATRQPWLLRAGDVRRHSPERLDCAQMVMRGHQVQAGANRGRAIQGAPSSRRAAPRHLCCMAQND